MHERLFTATSQTLFCRVAAVSRLGLLKLLRVLAPHRPCPSPPFIRLSITSILSSHFPVVTATSIQRRKRRVVLFFLSNRRRRQTRAVSPLTSFSSPHFSHPSQLRQFKDARDELDGAGRVRRHPRRASSRPRAGRRRLGGRRVGVNPCTHVVAESRGERCQHAGGDAATRLLVASSIVTLSFLAARVAPHLSRDDVATVVLIIAACAAIAQLSTPLARPQCQPPPWPRRRAVGRRVRVVAVVRQWRRS
jgi:hypothetical protein